MAHTTIQRSNIDFRELHVNSCWVHVGTFGIMTGHDGVIKKLGGHRGGPWGDHRVLHPHGGGSKGCPRGPPERPNRIK